MKNKERIKEQNIKNIWLSSVNNAWYDKFFKCKLGIEHHIGRFCKT